MTVASILKKRRKELGLTQAELAKKSGVSQQAISFIESGRNTPSEGTLRLLASALGFSVSGLLGETSSSSELTPRDHQLLTVVRQLNDTGFARVLSYAEDLVSSCNYEQEKKPAAG